MSGTQWRERRGLLVVVVVAAAVRFSTLSGRSFWSDETATLYVVRRSIGGLFSQLALTERAPPLYYVLTWGWTRLFGTSEAGLRSFSALVGTLTVAVVYAIGATLVSRRVGLVVASFAAVSPLLVWQSQDGRVYALFVLLSSLSFLFFLQVRAGSHRHALPLWAVASVLALATHYFAVFPVAAEALLIAYAQRRRSVVVPIGVVGAVAAALVPLAIHQQNLHGENPGIGNVPLWRRAAQTVVWFLVGPQPPLQRTCTTLAALLVAVGGWLVVRAAARDERRQLLLAGAIASAAIVAPLLLVAVGVDFWAARNIVCGWVPLAVVLAAGYAAPRAGRAGLLTAGALCALFIAVDVTTAETPKFEDADWRGAARALGPPLPDRLLVVSPVGGAYTLQLYRPCDRTAPTGGVRTSEIDLVGLGSNQHAFAKSPKPPRPRVVPAPAPGFLQVARRDARYYTLVRFRSDRPRLIASDTAARSALGGGAGNVYVEEVC
jgi:4-amino-4-deoxy-L-arabinose transferase-like glycosyltransferase